MGHKAFGLAVNPDFGQDLLARFNPQTDTLVFMCRSGKRSCLASEAAVKAGFKADKVFSMLGGFEGDKVKCQVSAYNGKRMLGGWKNEGLPWTYKIDPKLAYQPDLPQQETCQRSKADTDRSPGLAPRGIYLILPRMLHEASIPKA
ncbi:MAG: hypothetical protein JRI71_16605 [Deltaproteobacteria bacterium]|nr:hypothetical protein [Deltaproteobacteria bacterium]